jgi:hypothetical protein
VLRNAVQLLLRHNQLPDLAAVNAKTPLASVISPLNTSENGAGAHTTMVVPPMDMTRENSVDPPDVDEQSELVPAPMRSLYDLTRIRNLRSNVRRISDIHSIENDFIGQGIISQDEAEELFNWYMENVYQLLWAGMLVPHHTLQAARRHSTLLTAAVLTIAAMHAPDRGEALQKCYNVFATLTYSTLLSRVNSLDDIRALCLAAFYLSNLSYKLSGLAVRHAIEMNLHQAYHKLTRGHTELRDAVRLWYAVYVCERQFSIAYGRPPLLHEDLATANIESFLAHPSTQPGDIRLCAQVALFKILTEAYQTFGADPESPLTEPDFQQLRMFNFAVEQWRLLWQPRSADSPPIGSYPSKGIVLYYHFARFQLNSLALRALPPPSAATSEMLSYDRREAANIAIAAATSTLTLIFEEPDLRRAMTAVPIFTHTLIAFCATFLLKMAKTWGAVGLTQAASSPEWAEGPIGLGLNFNIAQVLSLSRRSAEFLAKVGESVSEKHLTRHIARGIGELLRFFDEKGATSAGGGVVAAPLRKPEVSDPAPGPVESLSDIAVSGSAVDFGDGYSMYDLIGSYGFGFDESFLGQGAFEPWPAEQ